MKRRIYLHSDRTRETAEVVIYVLYLKSHVGPENAVARFNDDDRSDGSAKPDDEEGTGMKEQKERRGD